MRAFAADLRALTPDQRRAFLASFLGWSLDAFDYFVLVFVIPEIAKAFNVGITTVSIATLLTLAMRPLGALAFGIIADRFGRRPALIADILFYSLIELLSGFAPNITILLVLRALYGIGMGGEWGVGAALAMESVPQRSRGLLSGLLQQGYVFGYLLAALVGYFVIPHLGWRWMFFVGVLPALLVLYIRSSVKESPAWRRQHEGGSGMWSAIAGNFGLFVYVIVLMTAFNFMSHGTQDLYPTFLKLQHHATAQTASVVAIIYNIGALLGGTFFGALSERIGRRRAIVIAALLAIPIVPLWAFSPSIGWLTVGAFAIQFMVQGAWGVVPAHLNELSPDPVRGTFPGFTYQLGNLIASVNLPLQTTLGKRYGGNYGLAMALVSLVVMLALAIITALGRERKGAIFARAPSGVPSRAPSRVRL